MTRRSLLLASLAARLRADAADDAWETVSSAARALVEATARKPPDRGTANQFLNYFDPKMPDYETLSTEATALIEQYDLEASLDPVENDGDDRHRELQVDWELRLKDPATEIVSTRRQLVVHVKLEKQGRKWRIVSFDPIAFFAPQHA